MFFTCLFRRNQPLARKLQPSEVNRVLILRWDLLGDMVLTTPVFNYLKAIHPQVEIDVLASAKNIGVIRNDPRISRTFLYQETWKFLSEIVAMRRRKYDVVFSFIHLRSATEGMMCNLFAPNAVKASVRRHKKYAPYFHTIAAPAAGAVQMADQFLSVIGDVIDCPPPEAKPSLFVTRKAGETAAAFLAARGIKEFVAVNLSAGKEFREWGKENYARLLSRLCQSDSSLIFVLLTTIENEAQAQFISHEAGASQVYLYPPTPDIMNIIALLAEASMVITPDTSIVHIASAVQRPVLGLYTIIGTLPQEFVPYGVPYRALLAEGRVPISTIPPAEVEKAFYSLRQELKPSAEANTQR